MGSDIYIVDILFTENHISDNIRSKGAGAQLVDSGSGDPH